jgi:hypothetical protein
LPGYPRGPSVFAQQPWWPLKPSSVVPAEECCCFDPVEYNRDQVSRENREIRAIEPFPATTAALTLLAACCCLTLAQPSQESRDAFACLVPATGRVPTRPLSWSSADARLTHAHLCGKAPLRRGASLAGPAVALHHDGVLAASPLGGLVAGCVCQGCGAILRLPFQSYHRLSPLRQPVAALLPLFLCGVLVSFLLSANTPPVTERHAVEVGHAYRCCASHHLRGPLPSAARPCAGTPMKQFSTLNPSGQAVDRPVRELLASEALVPSQHSSNQLQTLRYHTPAQDSPARLLAARLPVTPRCSFGCRETPSKTQTQPRPLPLLNAARQAPLVSERIEQIVEQISADMKEHQRESLQLDIVVPSALAPLP